MTLVECDIRYYRNIIMPVDNTINFLSKLVSFPTISHTPTTEIAAYIAEFFETLGFNVEHFKSVPESKQSNVICSIGPKGTKGLVLSGHMDVVPVEGQPWQSDPFHLIEKDGKLFGRGSVDMKGFIAAAMSALKAFKESDYKKELILIWTYDEEVGCYGSKLLSENIELLKRPLPEKCLIGEPTELNMICKHNGIASININLKGKSAHSSQPSWGINTISDAAKIVHEIDLFSQELKSMTDELLSQDHADAYTTINVAAINGGIAYNVIPENCLIKVSIRPIPGVNIDELIKSLTDRIYHISLQSSVTIDIIAKVPSLSTGQGTELEKQIGCHAKAKHSSAVAYATDGAHLQLMGMKPIIFGPGSINQAHKPNEFIDANELVNFVPTIQKIVKEMCM
ncbi:acetylornithine deacetylase [Francisellaceae bacterium]|nr:acetylornithine deacetylase [Francisellaceae bacterium]